MLHPNQVSGGQPSAMTLRAIVDWYIANYPAERSREFFTERRRVLLMFCAHPSDPPGPPFGERPITELRTFQLGEFIKATASLKSAWTRKRWASIVNACLNDAARQGVIDRNPFGGLRLPAGRAGRDWTEAEFRAVLRNSHPHFRRLAVFVRFSGCRPGEARKAEWKHISPEGKSIVLKEHKTARTGDVRRIQLNQVLCKLLVWIARHERKHSFIFLNYFGQPWVCGAVTWHLRKLRRRAGLAVDVRMHGLRHRFATASIENGVDIATLSQLLGHRNVSMTSRYIHLADKAPHLERAAEKAVGGATNGQAPASDRLAGLVELLLEKVTALEQATKQAPAKGGPG